MRLFSVQLPLVPLTVGQLVDRAAWPAHITLIGNFRAPDAVAVQAATARFAAATPPVRTVVGDEAWFGPDRTVTAGRRPARGDVLEAPVVSLAELDPPGRPGIAVVLGVWPLAGARQRG